MNLRWWDDFFCLWLYLNFFLSYFYQTSMFLGNYDHLRQECVGGWLGLGNFVAQFRSTLRFWDTQFSFKHGKTIYYHLVKFSFFFYISNSAIFQSNTWLSCTPPLGGSGTLGIVDGSFLFTGLYHDFTFFHSFATQFLHL